MSCRWQYSPSGIWGWLCLWSQSMKITSAMWTQPVWRLAWGTHWVGCPTSQHHKYSLSKYKKYLSDSQKCQCMIKKNKICIFLVSGNKGAVGVSFFFSGTSFGFVNCHLTSGSEKVLRYVVLIPTLYIKSLCPVSFLCCIENIFLSCNICNIQEEPELCGHSQIAFSGWQTAQCLWHQPALHPPLLVWRSQLQTWFRCTGRSGN